MILLVFAHPLEAQATLKALQAEPINSPFTTSSPFFPCFFSFKQGKIAISGMGAIRAAMATSYCLDGTSEIWNIGLCGALDDSLPLGMLYSIEKVYHSCLTPPLTETGQALFDETHPPLLIPSSPRTPKGHTRSSFEGPDKKAREELPSPLSLATIDYPLHNSEKKEELSSIASVVDMEGYGVAMVAQTAHKTVRLWKLVSDYCNSDSPQQIREKIGEYSEVIAENLMAQIEKKLLQQA